MSRIFHLNSYTDLGFVCGQVPSVSASLLLCNTFPTIMSDVSCKSDLNNYKSQRLSAAGLRLMYQSRISRVTSLIANNFKDIFTDSQLCVFT